MSNINLTGSYSKVGAYLLPQTSETEYKLILHHRKKAEEKKPSLYLMLQMGGKSVYLSSLYPTETANSYILETNKRYYHVTMGEAETVIEPLQSKVS